MIDSLGCSDTTAFTVFADSIEASFPVSEIPLCDGNITLSPEVTGVAGTPFYQWSTGASSSSITVSNTGLYYVTVQNSNGCSVSDSIEVIADDLIVNFSTTQASCHGGSDGCIQVEVAGGVPPYNYEWSNGQTGNPACNLPAGNYTVTVIDANGCQASISAEVSEPPPLSIIITEEQAPSCASSEDGELSVEVTGGTLPYNYQWSNNQSGNTLSDLAAGTYSLTVTDINGCSATLQYTLDPQSDATAVADAGPDQTITCLNPVITLDGTGSSEGPAYAYEWAGPGGSPLSNTLTLDVEEPGIYTLMVANTTVPGCTSSDEAVVAIDTVTPTVSLHYTLLNCDTARLTYTSDTPVAGLTWNLPDGDFTTADTVITALPGVYELTGPAWTMLAPLVKPS